MPRTNKTEFAILGLLLMGARTGYDIRKLVEEALSHFWHESYGHIYPVLSRLADRGWLTRAREESDRGPARNVYALTTEGRLAFDRWFEADITPTPARNELLLRLFFGKFAEEEVLSGHVRRFQQMYRTRRETLAGVRDAVAADPEADEHRRYWLLTLRMGELVTAALEQWADEALEELE